MRHKRVASRSHLPRHNAIENFPTHPALNTFSIKLPLGHSCLLRTYSARIYFIVSNSSLACLHMPLLSHPVDDIRVRPSYREHGRPLLFGGRVWSRGRLARSGAAVCFAVVRWACQRVGRQSDGCLLCICILYVTLCNGIGS